MIKLSSDELGELGQNAFKALCSEEGLHANIAERDRTGWDFRIEQPSSVLPKGTLVDLRSVPEPIMVQVKAVRGSKSTISLNLRTFERLAKLTEPTFVVIPKIGNDQKIKELWAIHLVGSALEKGLQRLAEATQKTGTIEPKATISFSQKKWWQSVDLTKNRPLSTYFEAAIEDYRGGQPYAARKARELSEVGYPKDGFYSMQVTVQATNIEEIYKGFLGLGELTVHAFQGFDHRFGMTRPGNLPDITGHSMRVEPSSEQQFILRLHNAALKDQRDMQVEVRTLPFSGSDPRLLIILHQLHIYVLPDQGRVQIWIDPVEGLKQPAAAWADVYATFYQLSRGQSEIALLHNDYREAFSLPAMTSAELSDGLAEQVEFMHKQALIAEECMALLGIPAEPIDVDDIIDDHHAFAQLRWTANEGSLTLSLSQQADNTNSAFKAEDKRQTIFIPGLISVGEKHVAYAYLGTAKFEETDGSLQLKCERNHDLSFQVVGDRRSIDRFFEQFVEHHRPEIRCTPDLPYDLFPTSKENSSTDNQRS